MHGEPVEGAYGRAVDGGELEESHVFVHVVGVVRALFGGVVEIGAGTAVDVGVQQLAWRGSEGGKNVF